MVWNLDAENKNAMNKDVWNEALEMKSQGFNLKRPGGILLRGVYMKLVRDENVFFVHMTPFLRRCNFYSAIK